jgi:hypothetical protein
LSVLEDLAVVMQEKEVQRVDRQGVQVAPQEYLE